MTERERAGFVLGALFFVFGGRLAAEQLPLATRDDLPPAFELQIENAVEAPVDAKSALQELLAQRHARVTYAVTGESGPAHRRTFAVEAKVGAESVGTGAGKSKKAAEQMAAEEALRRLGG